MMSQRPYVDFREVKQVISLPEVLEVFGIRDQFRQTGQTITGVCPLIQHEHGPRPNPEQFKATVRDGIWLWHCFGDCHRGGDVIELVKLMTGYENGHVRFWFAEHFADRLTLKKPKRNESEKSSTEKEEAREVGQEPPRAKAKSTNGNLPANQPPLKPLRFHLKLETDVPYLRRRGLQPETIRRYGLGLCRKGMLAGYVAIPVYGYPRTEYPLAYLGRWPGEDFDEEAGRPRYKWPPGFPKQQVVYGLAEALESPAGMPLVCVEGPFSVYHLVQAGLSSAVAVFGSSLSDEQATQLVETDRPIVLMFDGDEAGQAGMRQAAGKLIPQSFVRIVKLAEGLQPEALSADELRSILSFVR